MNHCRSSSTHGCTVAHRSGLSALHTVPPKLRRVRCMKRRRSAVSHVRDILPRQFDTRVHGHPPKWPSILHTSLPKLRRVRCASYRLPNKHPRSLTIQPYNECRASGRRTPERSITEEAESAIGKFERCQAVNLAPEMTGNSATQPTRSHDNRQHQECAAVSHPTPEGAESTLPVAASCDLRDVAFVAVASSEARDSALQGGAC